MRKREERNFLCKCSYFSFSGVFHIGGIIYHRRYILYVIHFLLFLLFTVFIYCLIYLFTRVTVKTTKLRGITLSNFITIILAGVVLAQLYRRYFTPRHL